MPSQVSRCRTHCPRQSETFAGKTRRPNDLQDIRTGPVGSIIMNSVPNDVLMMRSYSRPNRRGDKWCSRGHLTMEHIGDTRVALFGVVASTLDQSVVGSWVGLASFAGVLGYLKLKPRNSSPPYVGHGPSIKSLVVIGSDEPYASQAMKKLA